MGYFIAHTDKTLRIDACVHEGVAYIGSANLIQNMRHPKNHKRVEAFSGNAEPDYLPRMQTYLEMLKLAVCGFDADEAKDRAMITSVLQDTALFPQTAEAMRNAYGHAVAKVLPPVQFEELEKANIQLRRFLQLKSEQLNLPQPAEQLGISKEEYDKMDAVLYPYIRTMVSQLRHESSYLMPLSVTGQQVHKLAEILEEAERLENRFGIITRSN